LFDDLSTLLDAGTETPLFDGLTSLLENFAAPAAPAKENKDLLFLLYGMKTFIERGILFKSDSFYNVVSSSSEIVPTSDLDMDIYKHDLWRKGKEFIPGTYYDLRFAVDSESYRIYDAYMRSGGSLSVEDIKGLQISSVAKGFFIETMENSGLEEAISYYKILERPKYASFARSTSIEDLEVVRELLESFVGYRGGLDLEEKCFNFIRASRKMKNDAPACFDGNCLEKNILNGKISIFSREID